MSYGMFSDIMRLVGSTQDVASLLITDSSTRDLVIRRLYTDNNRAIDKIEELIDSFEIDILPTELDGVMAWVADHAAHFLLSTGRKMQEVAEKYQSDEDKRKEEKEASLSQSNSGSENSTT